MRYEKLSIPLAGGLFEITFHQHVTVLAGISSTDRAALVDAFASASVGSIPGGSLIFRDCGGRRIAIKDFHLTYLDGAGDENAVASMAVNTDAKSMRNLLSVAADDLGLPRPIGDRSLLPLQAELLTTREELATARTNLQRFQESRVRRERVLAELRHTEETLASLGGPTDRYLHERARNLVELEKIRAVISAVEASPQARERDSRLLGATDIVQSLADEWASSSGTLDELRVKFRDRTRIDAAELATLVALPDEPPNGLAPVIAEFESATARVDHLQTEAEAAKSGRRTESPNDPRILVLSTIDQDTLWMAHRRMRMATDAINAAIAEEESFNATVPDLMNRIEQANAKVAATEARAEALWLRGILATTILVCLGILVPTAGYGPAASPALFALAAIMFTLCVVIPRRRHRKASVAEAAVIKESGAGSVDEFRQRFADGPSSSRWRRADQMVEEYQSANEEWQFLVGDLTVDEVGELEDQVLAWTEASDPAVRAARVTSINRSLTHARSDLETASRNLNALLRPLGLDTDGMSVAVSAAVHERIQLGRRARLQVALEEAQEAEDKLKNRLGDLLASVGFEDGTLEARIGAFGWAIDGARQRRNMQASAPPLNELKATQERLEGILREEPPAAVDNTPSHVVDEGPHITALRTRREELRKESKQLRLGDEDAESRRIAKLEKNLATLEAELSPEAGMVVSKPVDHLVETLVRFRPSWPAAPDETLPALLDDPFQATPETLRLQLLNALGEVAKVTQIILLTDDDIIAGWARNQAARGTACLLEPA